MKKMTSLLLMLCLAIISQAQTNKGKITGHVQDGNQKLVESATITLLKSTDSTVAKMGAANKEGNFEFENIADGRYLVSVSAVGHKKAFSETFEINEANILVALKTIELVPVSKDLTGVTVVARKPLIEQHIDRTVINVEAAVSNVGATALEVLEKSPGITVDKDGSISLKGKQGVQVYIDGKPSYLGGAD